MPIRVFQQPYCTQMYTSKQETSKSSSEKKEIADLQRVRATLEAVRQVTDRIHADVASSLGNHQAIDKETARTIEVLKKI